MSLPEGNPRIPEGINAHNDNPLREFLVLAIGVSAALVFAVAALSLSIHLLAPCIPFAWEARALPQDGLPLGPTSPDAREDAVAALGASLLESSLALPIEGEPPAQRVPPAYFHFHLVDMDAPNAFATLGANIAVTLPLLNSVDSENGLAMVLAHEIAHVQLRHPIEAAGRGVVVQIALAALLGRNANSLWGSSLGAGGLFTLLSFNREMELAADRRALAILRQHYGHTAGADGFFRAIDDGPGQWAEFTRTHPSSERRIALIREAMAGDSADAHTRPLPEALRSATPAADPGDGEPALQ
ncbi:M48 family metallopeptidase [Haliea sp. E17]|uniref:M48 family metallopeptidase n=1 Tax=Haliea sp. E17 TaxID=3401576 RepID=UPI003AAB57D5